MQSFIMPGGPNNLVLSRDSLLYYMLGPFIGGALAGLYALMTKSFLEPKVEEELQ